MGKKESKSKMQVILVVLERFNDEHLASERERKREAYTPYFQTRTPKVPKTVDSFRGARRPALDFLVAGPLQLINRVTVSFII